MRNLLSSLKSLNILVSGSGFGFGLVLALALPMLADAEEIYHWVDADGVHHYSQSPPPETSSEVETLNVDGSQPGSYNPDEDRYNIAAQEAAMQELRDKLAESKKNNQQEQQTLAANTIVYYPEPNYGNEIYFPPGYGANPPYWPDRPGPPDRPSRPGGKPDRPDRPGTLPEEAPPASRPYKPRP